MFPENFVHNQLDVLRNSWRFFLTVLFLVFLFIVSGYFLKNCQRLFFKKLS